MFKSIQTAACLEFFLLDIGARCRILESVTTTHPKLYVEMLDLHLQKPFFIIIIIIIIIIIMICTVSVLSDWQANVSDYPT